MNNDYNNDYQYNSCVSRGLCSINPRTSALQQVLITYLKITAYYSTNLENIDFEKNTVKDIILDTISAMVSNPEFSETDFVELIKRFNVILPKLINKCKELNLIENNELNKFNLNPIFNFDEEIDVIKAIKHGERELIKLSEDISNEIQDLYKILFVLAKSICINLIDLGSVSQDYNNNFSAILEILTSLNEQNQNAEFLKELVIKMSNVDNELMKNKKKELSKRYGTPRPKEVSYSTRPHKAILVVGSNLKELEDILEATKNTDIDIYTHDEMILANLYPKFEEYKNLRGQYGQGLENCLLDFATFPGPIVLTQHSLYNVENLYRGKLYTTDFISTKGVISIKNNNYDELIKDAEKSKGFKTGKQCESIKIGYNLEDLLNMIKEKIETKSIKKIVLIGLGGYTAEERTYIKSFFKQIPDDILIISSSIQNKRENIIYINACFDSYAIVKITNEIQKISDINMSIIFPKCDRHTMSQMIYLSNKKNIKIFVGKCTPVILNPNLIITLNKIFNIKSLSTVKKDLNEI